MEPRHQDFHRIVLEVKLWSCATNFRVYREMICGYQESRRKIHCEAESLGELVGLFIYYTEGGFVDVVIMFS